MTPNQIVALGVRLFSVFVLFEAFEYLAHIPAQIANTNLASYSYVSYSFGALGVTVALLLWFFPLATANCIVPKATAEHRLDLHAFDAARVGCSLIGLWLFASALPAILWFSFRGVTYSVSSQSMIGSLDAEDQIRLAYYSVQLVLSFFLVFKSHLFASLALGRARHSSERP